METLEKGYNKILDEQIVVQQKLEKDNKVAIEIFTKINSLSNDTKQKAYDKFASTIEETRIRFSQGIKFLDEKMAVINDNANKIRIIVRNLNELLDNTMKTLNDARIGTLQGNLRYMIKQTYNTKLDSLPEKIKTVVEETYDS